MDEIIAITKQTVKCQTDNNALAQNEAKISWYLFEKKLTNEKANIQRFLQGNEWRRTRINT